MSIDIYRKTLEEKSKLNFKDINVFKKEYISLYKFKTKSGESISYKLLMKAEKVINRMEGRNQINKFVNNLLISTEIEKGLFEFSLITVTFNNLQMSFVENIYNDKLYDLCCNLDVNNEQVQNETLLPNILNETFNPYFVPFLQKEIIHPKRWYDQIEKQNATNDVMKNLKYCDTYQCKKCKERKFSIAEIQLRSADEPMNKILTCMNCCFTFII